MSALFIGLMSGTSLDGVDGVLADFATAPGRILGHASAPFPDALRAELLALNTSGPDELHRAALAANALAERGEFIEAGAIVLTGGMTDAVPISAGDQISAEFTNLGSLTVTAQ